jgi:photosystem II stability/assembly factor-like uncharacterized protein
MIRLYFLLHLCFFVSLQANTQSGWSATTIPASGRYDDIFFLNDNVGWAAGGDFKIFHTRDGGDSWQLQFSSTHYLRSIEFATPQLGFCGSLDSSFYKTTDGGKTWTDISSEINPKPPGICGLSTPDSLHIYGCGIWNSPAYLIRSADGGTTWTYTDMSAYAHTLVDIYFINKDTGFASGTANPATEGGIVLYTTDGGNTWQTKFKTMIPDEYIWKIQSPDNIHFFGSVNSPPSSTTTRMLQSSDRGITWRSRVIKNMFYDVEMIGFTDSLTGWTGGRSSLFKTTDGGLTWSDNLINTTRNYNRFFLTSKGTAYLSGTRIYKQKFGNPVISPRDSTIEHTISYSPNPTESFSRVDIDFKQNTFANLSLYSLEGKKLQTLLHEKVARGKKSINIFLTKYPVGAYFLVLRTNEGFLNIKVIKR